MNTEEWPFDEEYHLATITTYKVLEEKFPILLVTHDAEDGGWQFLCGTTNNTEDARIVSLYHIFSLDPTVGTLADLPCGWRAWRETQTDSWKRQPR